MIHVRAASASASCAPRCAIHAAAVAVSTAALALLAAPCRSCTWPIWTQLPYLRTNRRLMAFCRFHSLLARIPDRDQLRPTIAWSRRMKLAGASAPSATGCGCSPPRRRRSTRFAPAAGSTMPQRSWGPTSPACSCVTLHRTHCPRPTPTAAPIESPRDGRDPERRAVTDRPIPNVRLRRIAPVNKDRRLRRRIPMAVHLLRADDRRQDKSQQPERCRHQATPSHFTATPFPWQLLATKPPHALFQTQPPLRWGSRAVTPAGSLARLKPFRQ